MKLLFRIHILAAVFAVLWLLPSPLKAQPNLLELFPDRKSEWKRLSTDDNSTTDVSVSSLVFESNGIFRATFRIQVGKPERAIEKPGIKYKTRMMTLQFDSRKNAYRTFETILLDSSKKVVYESGKLVDAPWIPGQAGIFYRAASKLSPLGLWSVVSSSDSVASGHITGLTTQLDRFQIGRTSCSVPDYESVSMTRDEFAKLSGIRTAASIVDMSTDKENAVKIKCSTSNLTSEVHFLILKSLDRAILLSGGELYVLEWLG